MASTEIQVLQAIWENKASASVFRIAKKLRLSTDYSRLICSGLARNNIVEFSEGQYNLTDLGKKELEKYGIIENLPARNALHSDAGGSIQKTSKLKSKSTVSKKKFFAPVFSSKVLKQYRCKTLANRKAKKKKATIKELSCVNSVLAKVLIQKGICTLEDMATAAVFRLMETVGDLELSKAAKMINEARAILKEEGKERLWEPPMP